MKSWWNVCWVVLVSALLLIIGGGPGSVCVCEASSSGSSPLSTVQVTLRGKKYDIQDVTTVAELQERVSEASGIDPSQQGRVLFDGKRLSSTDTLSSMGVTEGSQLNMIPGGSKKKKSSTSGTKSSTSSSTSSSSTTKGSTIAANAAAAALPSTSNAATSSASASAASQDPTQLARDMLAQAGIDPTQMEEMAKSFGLGGAGGAGSGAGGMPDMQQGLDMMSQMTKSDVFQEYMNDPDRLEESRQMILNNPMLKGMMGGMPGMEELLNDKDAFREAMQAAASMYENMDTNDLMQAMMMGGPDGSGPGAGGGMPGGMGGAGMPNFGGMDLSSMALDELSEGED